MLLGGVGEMLDELVGHEVPASGVVLHADWGDLLREGAEAAGDGPVGVCPLPCHLKRVSPTGLFNRNDLLLQTEHQSKVCQMVQSRMFPSTIWYSTKRGGEKSCMFPSTIW